MKIAVPCAEGKLCLHFGHCQEFFVAEIEKGSTEIKSTERLDPPPHQPGLLPVWLAEKGVSLVIAGGMGGRAQGIFAQNNIEVITGAPVENPEKVITNYLKGSLQTGDNTCDH